MGYCDEPGVARGSQTETLAVVRDNWRWAGVPCVLRSGKRLAASGQLITLGFRQPPLRMFPIDRGHTPASRRNEIAIDFANPGLRSRGITMPHRAQVASLPPPRPPRYPLTSPQQPAPP